MAKKTRTILLICLVVIAGTILFFNKTKILSSDNSIVIFYSDSCPHCLNVEKFLEENKVSEKVAYIRKSVDNNPANIFQLREKALVCNLFGDVGIPFLWDGQNSKCLVGDEDVINFFKDRIASLTVSN